jgi:quinol monooxygenase YgiN
MHKKFYGLHGHLLAATGKGPALADILISASHMLTGAHGCYMYMVGTDSENPDKILVTEVWENKEAHANSLQLPEVQELIQKAIPMLDGSPEKGTEFFVAPETLNR